MKTTWNIANVAAVARRFVQQPSTLLWAAGGGASVALVLMSCATTGRALMAPPSIPGATFVGSDTCASCHEKVSKGFKTADHAKLQVKGKNAIDMGCESCHGPGSKHVDAGGGAGTIVNPRKSPETCFQCHLDKKAEFSMPYSHPVLAGKMTCGDCHDPHTGSSIKGGGTQLHGKNENCAECHRAQAQHFVFAHDAVKEGCTTCHNPHGSINQKMLTERNATLCLKCHTDAHTASGGTLGPSGGHAIRFRQGTCWSAGCHEAVHGSNTNVELRF